MKISALLAATLLAGSLAGCVTPTTGSNVSSERAMKTTITGEVFYLPRIALPPQSELGVVLLDSSLENPLVELFAASTSSLNGKNVPVPFSLEVDQSRLIAGDTYVVRAVIRSNTGDIIWRTKDAHTVDLSTVAYDAGQLEMVMVERPANRGDLLTGDAWAVESINGGGVIDNSNVTITFDAEGKISGSGGCNYYSGNYEANNSVINVIGGIALTRRACATALMQQDQRLLTVLQQAQSYSVSDGLLTIVTKNGRTITARRS